MRLPSISFLAGTASKTIRRFPMAILMMALVVVLGIILIENSQEDSLEEKLVRLLLTALMAWPFFIGLRLSFEKYNVGLIRRLVVILLALSFFVIYYFHGFQPAIDHVEVVFRLLALLLLGHLYVSFAAFRDRKELRGFWVFNQNIFLHFLEATVVAVIIGAGLSLALLALDELFNANIDSTLYGDLLIVVGGLFHPVYFLSKTPSLQNTTEEKYTSYPAFTNVVRYVLIPLVGLYFIILYAFSAKILFSWELPEGWVSKMVLGFSIAGIFTYLINYRMAEHENSSILSGFRKWYFPVLAPMVILILIAIGRRISDYGITEGRYVVLVLGIWLGLVSLYFIFSKKDDIRVIPVSLALFCFLSILGPWRAVNVSFKSQQDRLEEFLQKENLIKDGTLTVTNLPVEKESISEITGILDFLVERDSVRLRKAFHISDSVEMDIHSIMRSVNLQPERNGFRGRASALRYYTLDKDAPILTDGFDNLLHFQLYGAEENGKNVIYLSKGGSNLIFSVPDGPEISLDLAAFFKKISAKEEGNYNASILSLLFNQEGVSGKIIFENLNLEVDGNDIKARSAAVSVLWSK